MPTYWILDVPAGVIVEHRHPGPRGYRAVRRVAGATAPGTERALTAREVAG